MAEGKCIGTKPICLADGRRLHPGQPPVAGIDLEHPENKALVEAGVLLVLVEDHFDTTQSIPAVMAWVGTNRDRAREALAAELARPENDRRSTLIDQLEQLVANPEED